MKLLYASLCIVGREVSVEKLIVPKKTKTNIRNFNVSNELLVITANSSSTKRRLDWFSRAKHWPSTGQQKAALINNCQMVGEFNCTSHERNGFVTETDSGDG